MPHLNKYTHTHTQKKMTGIASFPYEQRKTK